MYLEIDQIEKILVLLCLNDLYFLYKHVINALDSSGITVDSMILVTVPGFYTQKRLRFSFLNRGTFGFVSPSLSS